MTSEPLTLAEAVPLGTVHMQRILADVGVRSLAIKGPAFVELGVRRPKVSRDIDLVIHPEDRVRAVAALTRAGWSRVSLWFPPVVEDIIYSTTVSHPHFPASVDMHHWLKGMLTWPSAFEVLWDQRTRVVVAHSEVDSPCAGHALVLEFLNAAKKAPQERWGDVAQAVVTTADRQQFETVLEAARALGVRETAAPLIVALGGPRLSGDPSAEFQAWLVARDRSDDNAVFERLLRRAPLQILGWLWRRLTFGDDVARNWARVRGVPYTGTARVIVLRLRERARRRRDASLPSSTLS